MKRTDAAEEKDFGMIFDIISRKRALMSVPEADDVLVTRRK